MRVRYFLMRELLGQPLPQPRLLNPLLLTPQAVPFVVLLHHRNQLSRRVLRTRPVSFRDWMSWVHDLLRKNLTPLLRNERE